jgi:hypothetical protein
LLLACMVTAALVVAGLIAIARVALSNGVEDQSPSSSEDERTIAG